eukprot:jgi/Mesvir1/5240/Mv25543-RA.1
MQPGPASWRRRPDNVFSNNTNLNFRDWSGWHASGTTNGTREPRNCGRQEDKGFKAHAFEASQNRMRGFTLSNRCISMWPEFFSSCGVVCRQFVVGPGTLIMIARSQFTTPLAWHLCTAIHRSASLSYRQLLTTCERESVVV